MSVRAMCRLLEVAPSGFYAWCTRPPSARTIANQTLTETIQSIQATSGFRYGSRRIQASLRQQGVRVGRHRVRRLMRSANIHPRRTKWRRQTTVRTCGASAAPNHLQRQFTVTAPHACWVGDITAIPLRNGTAYLAGVLDLYTRKVVGWTLDGRMDATLVERALQMAVTQTQQRPVMHHTDQGSQYTSAAYQALVRQHGITMSMSDVGKCYDNAPMESLWATLKTELTHHRTYDSLGVLRRDLFEYIEIFYNRQRLHSSLAYQTPAMLEAAWSG
jgi:putative transposase